MWQKFVKAYHQTPFLWNGPLEGYGFTNFIEFESHSFDFEPKNKRFGNICEELFVRNLSQNEQMNVLCENLQITKPKETLGEIDCIVSYQEFIIHLEHTFKFYLGEPNENELLQWIGPNRKDSLIEKLKKIKSKQFPLLRKTETVEYLNQRFQLDAKNISQQTVFKAQLFVPQQNKLIFKELNEDCVIGHYYTFEEFKTFQTSQFYFPSKIEWLLPPSLNNHFSDFKEAEKNLLRHFENKKSPMVWMKHNDGRLEKCFFVWWDL